MECMRCVVCNYRGLQLADGRALEAETRCNSDGSVDMRPGSAPVMRRDVDNSHDIMKESMKTVQYPHIDVYRGR